jgi:glycosyltransferase involved in cell wall biosynthesis
MPERLFLVIPAYHESRRLPRFLPALCDALSASEVSVTVQVVDDGSGAAEQQTMSGFLDGLRSRHPFLRPLHRLERNVGKGGTVYAGWDLAEESEWLGFVDADGAVPASEVARLALMTGEDPGAEAIFAVRVSGAGRTVTRTFSRRITGLVFRWLAHALFDIPIPDTQCGLKFVSAARYREIRPQLREMRFCFDVELTCLLLRAGVGILPVPIDWHESPGGKVHARAIIEMIASLLRLRRRKAAG